MAKSSGVPKTAAKAKVEGKDKVKAKAKATSQAAHPVDDANEVCRSEISKFTTALKYKAKNPKDPQAHGAQIVLEDRGYKKKVNPNLYHTYIHIYI